MPFLPFSTDSLGVLRSYEIFENLLALWTHYGRQPTFGELKRPPSLVGPKAYVRRWGGWRAALSAFVKRVNESPGLQTEPAEAELQRPTAENKDSTDIGDKLGTSIKL